MNDPPASSIAAPSRWATVVLAVLLAAAAGAPSASAAPAVTNTNDSGPGSLRASLAGAVNGESIGVPPGTYRLSSQLTVSAAVELDGAGAKATVITGQGITRVFNVTATGMVTISDLSVVGGRASGNGGGILRTGTGALELLRTTIRGNAANAGSSAGGGGGGVHHGSGSLTIADTTISENTANTSGTGSGGGGLFSSSGATIRNSTISRNRLNVTGSPAGAGGGGYRTGTGSGLMNNVTLLVNTTSGPPGGGIYNGGGGAVSVFNTILANNAAGASLNDNCENAAAIASGGNNLDSGSGCGLTGELENTNPVIGALEDNGGPTPTHRLFPNSPAIDGGMDANCEQDDQRGAERPAPNNNECDIGAVEFEGLAQAAVPNCTRTGVIPFSMFSPPDAGVEGLNYKIDGGPQQQVPLLGGGESASGSLLIPEGRRQLEFWADSTPTGDQVGVELIHHFPTVVVDRTNPRVAVSNPNRFAIFVISRRVNVNVSASDSISGLTSDPTGANRLSTASRGAKTFAPAAIDLCANRATDPFSYRVLAPRLGVRTVIEELSNGVRVGPRAGSSGEARASQKGVRFRAVRQPRELRIGSFIDTRRGRARITSARGRREANIQDGVFAGGVFQVLQSRRSRARGLTELRLKGGSFRRCRARRSTSASAARLSRRAIRRLRARGTRGRFRTRGRYSAATVRGTNYEVVDRCDGTLTRVTRGRVVVRDFKRRRTIVVRAGKSYLARAPG